MLRSALAAVALSVGLGAGGVAAAWTDPAGRIEFNAPSGWVVQPQNAGEVTYVITATGVAECHVVAQTNPLAERTINDLRQATDNDEAYDNATWTRIVSALFAPIFRDGVVNIVSTSKDASGPWIVRHAEVQGSEQAARVTMQSRPGFDMLSACMSFGGTPPTATFEALEQSIRHPNDATWEAAAAAEPAPEAPAAE